MQVLHLIKKKNNMAQIVGINSDIFRCNLSAIQTGGSKAGVVLAADEVWLINTTNTLTNSGSGECDAYVVGNGRDAATALKLKSLVDDGVFDISTYRATGDVLAKYADIAAALDGGNNIPEAIRKGGMSVKFVQSSDNKYVQYRLMADEFSAAVADWQGVDDEPTPNSDNLVKSGGVEKAISLTSQYLTAIGKGNTLAYGSAVRGFRAGCTYKFYIENYNELKDKITEGGYGSVIVFSIEANNKEDFSGVGTNLLKIDVNRIRDTYFFNIPQTVENTTVEEWYVRIRVRTENGYKVLVAIEDQTSAIANRDYNIFSGNTGTLDSSNQRSQMIPIPTFNGSFYKLTNLSNQTANFSTIDFSGQWGKYALSCVGGGSIVFQQTKDCDFIYANIGNIDFIVEKLTVPTYNVINGSSMLYEQGAYTNNNAKKYYSKFVRTKHLINALADNCVLVMPEGFVVRSYNMCNADGSFVSNSGTLNKKIVLLNNGYYLVNVMAESERDITPDELNLESDGQVLNYLANKAVDLIEDKASATISSSTTLFPYRTYKGHYYIVKNKGTATFNFNTKNLNDEFGAGVNSVPAGGSKVLIQTKDCDFLKTNINNTSFEIEEFKLGDLPVIDGTTFLYEQGYYNIAGNATSSDIYVRTKALFNVASDFALITVPDGFIIARSFDFDENRKFISTETGTTNYVLLKKGYHHINIKKEEADAKIVPSEVMCYGDMLQDVGLIHPITAAFDFNTELLNVDSELAGMDFGAKDSLDCWTFQEQIYAKWDALMTANPTLIEKIDLAEYVSEEYPEYANLNGVSSGNYAATPSYRTYMYKLCMPTSSVNVMDAVRRKVFIVAGLHGWENASQFNTYVVGSMLCKIASNDYYALGSIYDFYFIPCLNGYGAYHSTRQNANSVDINRNFPHPNWTKQGNPGDYSYTGETPASEFETRLVCKAVEIIKPDFFIDHHTYGPTSYNFYAECSNPLDWPIFYQNLYAWNYRACKEYPEYYGTKYPVRPNGFGSINYSAQTANIWAHNVGVVSSQTLEVCTGIGFINGEPNPSTTSTLYKAPIIRLNELMLRLMLLRFAEYQLKNGLRTSFLDSTLLVE